MLPFVTCAAVVLADAASPTAPPPAEPTVTTGAAPGYVADRVCANCHTEIAASYREIGMARSFYRPGDQPWIEDFSGSGTATNTGRFDHGLSRQSFALERRGGRLVFLRWQTTEDGKPINRFEQEVSWVLGSGNHARTYLYRTADGELYQLPLAWYTQEGRWGMAPGYDRPDHEGVLRRVRRECLFCHNGYPEVAAGSDAYGAPQTYPEKLPEGLGCQRCHGPGGEHVRRASGGTEPKETIRTAIVNPARLSGTLGDDVCSQCHLQPEVALPMVRRFGRRDYSFRPGEPLADYVVHTDLKEEGGPATGEERFEINHHGYRLRQSRCFAAGAEKLHCWTCHDPHRRLPQAELAARVRTACLSCHAGEAGGAGAACKRPGAPAPGAADVSDCASCHMPKRRPRDVVHVVMTDHKIQRRPGGPDLTAPRAEADPILKEVRLYAPERTGELGKVYLTLSVIRAGTFPSAVERLEGLLAGSSLTDPTPDLELAAAEIKEKRFAAAEQTLKTVLARQPEQPQALEWLGVVRAATGKGKEAEELFRRAASRPGADALEARFNLGLALEGEGRTAEAVSLFEEVLKGRGNFVAAWIHLGQATERLGKPERAATAYRQALAIDPGQTDAYLGLGRVLLKQGERAEAVRILTHGATAAKRPAAVAAALQAVPPPS